MRASSPVFSGVLVALVAILVAVGGAAATPSPDDPRDLPIWRWPLDGPRAVVAPYRAPAHDYAAGHRGVDLQAPMATVVRAPADGVVAFRGTVVDRPLLTIEHDGGLVSTFEPLLSALNPGDSVSAGEAIGIVDKGGHAAAGTLHVGVRLEGDYINPMLLFDSVPRAVLLPCCRPL